MCIESWLRRLTSPLSILTKRRPRRRLRHGLSHNAAPQSAELLEVRQLLSVDFLPHQDSEIGQKPKTLAVADFNRDGRLDLVAGSGELGNPRQGATYGTLNVIMGRGDGGFAAPQSVPSAMSMNQIVVGDFNGDRWPDVAGSTGESVLVFLNDGTGALRSPTSYTAGLTGKDTRSIAVGDFNGDGMSDLVLAMNPPWSGGVALRMLLSDGRGGFRDGGTYNDMSYIPNKIVVGDFNSDGNADVAEVAGSTSPGDGNGYLLLRFGNGTGALSDQQVSTLPFSTELATADLNGDGRLDLIVGLFSFYAVRAGDGAGGFGPVTWFDRPHGSGGYQRMALADLDGDGDTDIVSVESWYGTLCSVSLNDGTGAFRVASSSIVGTDYDPTNIVTGDFNGDGGADLAVTYRDSSKVSLYLNRNAVPTPPYVAPTLTVSTPNGGESLLTGTSYMVNWSISGTTTKISNQVVSLSLDGGTTWSNLTPAAGMSAASRCFNFIPTTSQTSMSALIRVQAMDPNGNVLSRDVSDRVFSIQIPVVASAVTVVSPNGGEVRFTTTNWAVYWAFNGTSNNVSYQHVALSKDGGTTWSNLTPTTGISASSRSFLFPVTSSLVSNTALVRVQAMDASGRVLFSDTSDSTFRIQELVTGPTLTVNTPNGGETLLVNGSSYTVNWTVSGSTSNINSQEVALSLDGGATWSILTPSSTGISATARYFAYTLTGSQVSSSAMFRVQAMDSSGNIVARDVSDSTFRIQNPIVVGPTNDNFAGRTMISGSIATVIGANINATKETGEPIHANRAGGKSVWWTWTAPSSGSATIDTIGSNFDTTLGVYLGSSVSALTNVASDDNSGGSGTSKVAYNAVAGTTYQIAVDGFGGTSGNITLHVSLAATQTVQTLDRGQTVNNLSGNQGSLRLYRVNVPSNAVSLTIQTSGGSGNVDLYGRYGTDAPSRTAYDFRPYLSGNNEAIHIPLPRTGALAIALDGRTDYSGVTLSVNWGDQTVATNSTSRGMPTRPATVNDFANRSSSNYTTVINQFNVETNPRYQPTSSATFCNIFAWDVMSAMNATLPHWVNSTSSGVPSTAGQGVELTANATQNWLSTFGNQYGWQTVSASDAQAAANLGKPTVALWQNPDSSKSGHIMVVRPGTYSTTDGCVIADAGSYCHNSTRVRTVLGSRTDAVTYWIFRN